MVRNLLIDGNFRFVIDLIGLFLVSSMNRMVNQVGTAQETPEIRQQLHQIRTYTQQLIKDTDTSLKDIVNCKDRHLKIQRDRLVDEFTAALTAFQAVQRKTVDLEKNAVRQAKANATIPKPPGSKQSQSNSYPESGFENNFIDSKGPTQLQMQEEIDLQALEDQERTIRELEDNIVGVNEIYKKLGALVYEQGNTIDSIEASVENTSVFVQEGTDQLRRASHYSVSFCEICKIFGSILIGFSFTESSAEEKNHFGADLGHDFGCYSPHDLFPLDVQFTKTLETRRYFSYKIINPTSMAGNSHSPSRLTQSFCVVFENFW